MDRTQREGFLLLLVCAAGYALLPILAKWLNQTGLTPVDVVIWRYAFAAPLIWLLITITRAPQPNIRLPRGALLLTGLLMTLAALSAFVGLTLLPAGIYVVLFYTYPAMVVIIGVLLGERLSGLGWLALLITIVGVALTAPEFFAGFVPLPLFDRLLTVPAQLQAPTGSTLGVALAFANALIVAIYFLVISRLLRGQGATARGSAYTITGALLFLLLLIPLRGLALPNSVEAWLLLLALASLSTVLPIFTMNAGIQRLGASRAAILSTMEPLLTLTLAALLLGEVLQPVQLVGCLLIIASVVLLQLRRAPVASKAHAHPATVAQPPADLRGA